ncbi:hypothetical protein CHS0354_001199 [Potamilus streckersoni]|uniref:Uncharacterized protein n=1 Tax=Potamilus streckersoni TaxID=2493646 RepID=A0AAE0VGT8_9BIVA|nr:hypothetical protein CHS0354_001199 [Potamilus streckersoni]
MDTFCTIGPNSLLEGLKQFFSAVQELFAELCLILNTTKDIERPFTHAMIQTSVTNQIDSTVFMQHGNNHIPILQREKSFFGKRRVEYRGRNEEITGTSLYQQVESLKGQEQIFHTHFILG